MLLPPVHLHVLSQLVNTLNLMTMIVNSIGQHRNVPTSVNKCLKTVNCKGFYFAVLIKVGMK